MSIISPYKSDPIPAASQSTREFIYEQTKAEIEDLVFGLNTPISVVWGAAGTGKTTYLRDAILGYLEQGAKVVGLSFSKAGVKALTDTEDKNLIILTVDALCWQMVRWSLFRSNKKPYLLGAADIEFDKEMTKEERWEKAKTFAKYEEIWQHDKPEKSQFNSSSFWNQIEIEEMIGRDPSEYQNQNLGKIKEEWQKNIFEGLGIARTIDNIEFTLKQKDFSVFLDAGTQWRAYDVLHKPDVVIVDEAQDLSPIHTRIIFKLAATAGRLVLGGDPDQNIFAHTNATSIPLLAGWDKENTEKKGLDRSYRCPSALCDASSKILNEVVPPYGVERFKVLGRDEIEEPAPHLSYEEQIKMASFTTRDYTSVLDFALSRALKDRRIAILAHTARMFGEKEGGKSFEEEDGNTPRISNLSSLHNPLYAENLSEWLDNQCVPFSFTPRSGTPKVCEMLFMRGAKGGTQTETLDNFINFAIDAYLDIQDAKHEMPDGEISFQKIKAFNTLYKYFGLGEKLQEKTRDVVRQKKDGANTIDYFLVEELATIIAKKKRGNKDEDAISTFLNFLNKGLVKIDLLGDEEEGHQIVRTEERLLGGEKIKEQIWVGTKPRKFVRWAEGMGLSIEQMRHLRGREDTNTERAIHLSNVHQAKGKEYDCCIIYSGATQAFLKNTSQAREDRLKLASVAITRASQEVLIVPSSKPQAQWNELFMHFSQDGKNGREIRNSLPSAPGQRPTEAPGWLLRDAIEANPNKEAG